MITPINFTGKAYFMDGALKTMTPEQKQRIEAYAQKKDEDTDVVVIGTMQEDIYEYKGKIYTEDKVGFRQSENGPVIDIETQNGTVEATFDNIKIKKRALPVYNAYILNENNKKYPNLTPAIKRFDFREGAKSFYTDSLSRDWGDIEF